MTHPCYTATANPHFGAHSHSLNGQGSRFHAPCQTTTVAGPKTPAATFPEIVLSLIYSIAIRADAVQCTVLRYGTVKTVITVF